MSEAAVPCRRCGSVRSKRRMLAGVFGPARAYCLDREACHVREMKRAHRVLVCEGFDTD